MTPRVAMARALAVGDDFMDLEPWETTVGQLEWGDKVAGQLRADGYLLVSEAELAAALLWWSQLPDNPRVAEAASAIFGRLSGAAQEKGEAGS